MVHVIKISALMVPLNTPDIEHPPSPQPEPIGKRQFYVGFIGVFFVSVCVFNFVMKSIDDSIHTGMYVVPVFLCETFVFVH